MANVKLGDVAKIFHGKEKIDGKDLARVIEAAEGEIADRDSQISDLQQGTTRKPIRRNRRM